MKRSAVIVALLMSFLFPMAALMYVLQRSVLKVPLCFYASLYFSLSVSSVNVYVAAVTFRLKTITSILKTQLNSANVKAVDEREHSLKVIRTLIGIYGDLMNICDETNICFSFQLLVCFGLIFFYTLITVFTAYTDVVNQKFLSPVTIIAIVYCAYYNFFLSAAIYTCVAAEQEVKVLMELQQIT